MPRYRDVVGSTLVAVTRETKLAGIAYLDMTSAEADRLTAEYATGDDRHVAAQHRHPRAQRQRLVVRVLLRAILVRYHPKPAATWRIMRHAGGAPYLAHDELIASPPFISLSHSGNLVACAFDADGPVGVDIERIRPDRPLEAIARMAFGPNELAAVAERGAASFYPIWTLREALAKATGAGFTLLVNGLDMVPELSLVGPAAHAAAASGWNLDYREVEGGYGLGTASKTVNRLCPHLPIFGS